MEIIKLTLDQIAFLDSFLSEFINNSNRTIEIIEKATSLTQIPQSEILKISPNTKSYEDAIDDLEEFSLGSQEEAAAMRRCIELATNKEDLRYLYKTYIYHYFNDDCYEMMYLVRRITEFL